MKIIISVPEIEAINVFYSQGTMAPLQKNISLKL